MNGLRRAPRSIVIDLLLENFERLWRGEAVLKNRFLTPPKSARQLAAL